MRRLAIKCSGKRQVAEPCVWCGFMLLTHKYTYTNTWVYAQIYLSQKGPQRYAAKYTEDFSGCDSGDLVCFHFGCIFK
jgi:hypothetical protein